MIFWVKWNDGDISGKSKFVHYQMGMLGHMAGGGSPSIRGAAPGEVLALERHGSNRISSTGFLRIQAYHREIIKEIFGLSKVNGHWLCAGIPPSAKSAINGRGVEENATSVLIENFPHRRYDTATEKDVSYASEQTTARIIIRKVAIVAHASELLIRSVDLTHALLQSDTVAFLAA